jgi:adhesin transport system outer membrane protein
VTRIAALTRQLEADRKTIAAFQKEYELGQRSLIDLLNAQNQYFNALVSLTSARGVVVFADYQLLAAMGTLLEYLKAPPPVDAAPMDLGIFGTPDYKVPTLRVKLPQTGSEPLNVPVPAPVTARLGYASEAPEPDAFKDRWPSRSNLASLVGASEWITQQRSTNDPVILQTSPATAYAADRKPHWLATAFEPVQR